MNIVRCPRCLDDVTVPMRASPKALVRCPLCLEEYLLREALGGLPPELVVLDGSEREEEPALVGADAGLAEVEQAELGGSGEYRMSGASYGAALDTGGPGAAVAAPRPAIKGARPKRKEKNGFVELIKIVLGGALGLTLGYFILLWGFSLDVLGLGPRMAPYAPWIVPAKFHGQSTDTSTAVASGSQDTSGDSSPATTGSKNGKANMAPPGMIEPIGGVAPSSATGPAPAGDSAAGASDAGGGLGGVIAEPELKPIPLPEPDLGPLLPEVNPRPATTAEANERSTDTTATPPESPATKSNTNSKTKPSTSPSPAPQTQPETKPLPTAEDLTKAVLAASDATTKVNEATGQPAEVRRQLFIDFYAAASDAGRVLSQLSADDPELAEQTATLKTALASLAMQPGKLSALKSLTDINLPERKHEQGVLLAGVAGEFAAAGTVHAATFQAGKSGTEAIVVSASDPKQAISAGEEILLVGRVIEDPTKNLPGYEGEATRVILLGCAVAAPKPE